MQILVGMTGIVIAMLSVTGVYIWWKKRRVRKLTASSQRAADNKARNQRIPNPQEAGL
jgi:uncharacterized iron-regulated membrane protein